MFVLAPFRGYVTYAGHLVRPTFFAPKNFFCAAALAELINRLSEFQQIPILKKLPHDAGRPLSLVTDPKSTDKPAQSKSKPTSQGRQIRLGSLDLAPNPAGSIAV